MCELALIGRLRERERERELYNRAPVSTDSVCTVSVIRGLPCGPKRSLKIKEINGS
jgi:hypothetical protein